MAANMGVPLAERLEATLADEPQPPNAVDEMWQEAAAQKEPFHFQFSLREMLVVMTGAALSLALLRLLGGPAATATLLGLLAIGGLVLYALGYEPPQNMVMAWW